MRSLVGIIHLERLWTMWNPFNWFKKKDECLFRVTYTMHKDKKLIIDVHSGRHDGISASDLAMFVSFISSNDGIFDTLNTIKMGLESNGQGEIYEEFLHSFLAFKKEEVEQTKEDDNVDNEQPLINPLEVL